MQVGIRTVILVVVLILFVVILFQNTANVTLRLLFWSVQAPQIILIPVILLIGFFMGFVVAKLIRRGKKSA